MKNSATRRSLLSCIISLVLCMAMLVGTTFAWFTDSVSSGKNTIIAGNLDVELYHTNASVTKETVQGATDLFEDVDAGHWEPGAMAYEKFTVENEGELALKYQFILNATNPTVVDGVSFTSLLKVAIVGSDFVYTRENAAKITTWESLSTFHLYGQLEKGASEDHGVIVWWQPSAQDNLFNINNGRSDQAKVDIGISLIATQLGSEYDSFGKDYDASADGFVSTIFGFGSEEDLEPFGGASSNLSVSNGEALVNGAGATNTVIGEALDKTKVTQSYDMDITDMAAGESITVSAGTQTQSTSLKVERGSAKIYVGEGFATLLGTLEGTEITVSHASYVDANGNLILTTVITDGSDSLTYTETFASIEASATLVWKIKEVTEASKVTIDNFAVNAVDLVEDMTVSVYTEAEIAAAFAAGKSVKLPADIITSKVLVVPEGKSVTLDLNGFNLKAADPQNSYAINNHGNLTIMDSAASSGKSGSVVARGIYNGYDAEGAHHTNAKLTVMNGIFNAMGTNGGAAVYNYGELVIHDGNFTSVGGYALNNQASGKITVYNGNVRGGIYNLGDLTIEKADVYQHISGRHAIYNWMGSVTINDGTFDSESGNELILADGTDASVVINGGIFDKTAKSWLFGAATGKNITFIITGGTFNGYVNKPEMSVDTVRPFGDKFEIYGGTFNFDPTQWVVEDFTVTKVADMSYTVSYNGMLVRTAEELALALATGTNVKLMADIAVSEKIAIPEGKVNVLDLNGKTISTTGGNAIYNEGDLTIIGAGKITSVSNYAIRVQRGSLLIDSNDVEVSSDFGAISVFNGANVTINGGHYFNRGYNDKTSHAIYLGGYGTININGGTFDSGYSNGGIDTICGYGWSNTENAKAVINICGGEFYPSELDGAYFFISNYDGSWTEINISGGTFHKYDPAKIGGTKLAAGFVSVAGADSTFTVQPE